MAATNTPQILDQAILRRFDKLIYIPLPDKNARSDMFKNFLLDDQTKITLEDINELSKITNGLTGSDISVICRKSKALSMERLQTSTHFQKVFNGNNEKFSYKPCVPSDNGAICINLRDIPAGVGQIIFVPVTTKEDVIRCAKEAKPRYDLAQLREVEEFAKKMGEGDLLEEQIEEEVGRLYRLVFRNVLLTIFGVSTAIVSICYR